ncbi:MAG: sensor histidine kinase [Reyranella sp.]|uniref:sensor histidine kinase n=1 Tax=Reyranella sp. TaxID=1929291 RepID=UPI003D0DE479
MNAIVRTAGSIGEYWNGLRLFWRAQLIGWGFFAILDLVYQRLIYHEFWVAASRALPTVLSLVVVSSILHSIYTSRRFDGGLTRRTVIWILGLSIAMALPVAVFAFAASEWLDWSVPGRDPLDDFAFPLIHYSIVLCGWSLCYFWLRAETAKQAEHRHAMRSEAEALRARLEELRLQLDPHFLFNALNGVAEEIPDHPTAALAMLRDLTAYLRHSLDGIHQTVVTVEAEVAGLSAYLGVQRARFGERLRTSLHVDPEAATRRIASFLLQPLVENAVQHGNRDHGLDVGIDIRAAGDRLYITIDNTGTLDDHATPRRNHSGIGLENVRRRLALHYPNRHQFVLQQAENGESRVVATMILEGEPCSAP